MNQSHPRIRLDDRPDGKGGVAWIAKPFAGQRPHTKVPR